MALKITNNAFSTLVGDITDSATSLAVQSGDGAKFPSLSAGDWFPVTVVDSLGTMEIMRCTARSGSVLTVVRAQEGTTAAAFSSGARVDLRLTAGALNERFDAISAVANMAAPTGVIKKFGMSAAPDGWLECNGATLSRTAYASLFAAIGTAFGAGDGSTTFAIPDLRGEFPRGWDNGRGVDTGRGFGSAQGSQNLSHSHGVNDPGHSHPYTRAWSGGSYGGGPYGNRDFDATLNTGHVGTGISIQASGGNEARPRNIALLFCIKY